MRKNGVELTDVALMVGSAVGFVASVTAILSYLNVDPEDLRPGLFYVYPILMLSLGFVLGACTTAMAVRFRKGESIWVRRQMSALPGDMFGVLSALYENGGSGTLPMDPVVGELVRRRLICATAYKPGSPDAYCSLPPAVMRYFWKHA